MVVELSNYQKVRTTLDKYISPIRVPDNIGEKIAKYKSDIDYFSCFNEISTIEIVEKIDCIAKITPQLKCLEFIQGWQQTNFQISRLDIKCLELTQEKNNQIFPSFALFDSEKTKPVCSWDDCSLSDTEPKIYGQLISQSCQQNNILARLSRLISQGNICHNYSLVLNQGLSSIETKKIKLKELLGEFDNLGNFYLLVKVEDWSLASESSSIEATEANSFLVASIGNSHHREWFCFTN